MIYTGIGSRETPQDVLNIFIKMGKWFGLNNHTLRSGGANGADSAFERGCDLSNGQKEIYLPWKNFNGNDSELILSNPLAYEIAEKYHPYWYNLSDGAKKLQARNSHQVLGLDLNTPCDLVICYTSSKGGTTQALRIAKDYGVKIFNAYEYKHLNEFSMDVWNYVKEKI